MRIESVEAIPTTNACFVRVTTDDGTVGVGESTFFGWPTAVAEIARSFAASLRGKDPLELERHGLSLYRSLSFRGMAVSGAISALDQALWDIKGKHFDAPVWQLLGGRARTAVRAMRVLVEEGSREQVADAARRCVVDDGYTALKILLFQHDHHTMRQAARIDDLVGRFAAIRETVGWEIDLGVELHRNMNAGDAVLLSRELERFRPLFIEDPIPPDSVAALRAFAAKIDLPVAAGERNTTIWEFAEYLERPGVAYVRPDVGIAGGITHVKKICALAEAFHAGILPHAVPWGRSDSPPTCSSECALPTGSSRSMYPRPNRGFTDSCPPGDRGARRVPAGPRRPGLRIELLDAGLARQPPTPDAPPPDAPRREDGSISIR